MHCTLIDVTVVWSEVPVAKVYHVQGEPCQNLSKCVMKTELPIALTIIFWEIKKNGMYLT